MNPNLAEYLTPNLYDLENPDFEPEGLFFLELARETGGPVLEIGCGTGRMTIPMAKAGLDMTGLDIVPEMLERAKEKAGKLPITWVETDARTYALNRKFRFIFECGSVFMHQLTNADQQAFLARVREHLAPDGRFVVSVFFPHRENLENVLQEKEWFTYQDDLGQTVRVSGTEAYDELTQVKTETAIRRVTQLDGEEKVLVAPLNLRYTFPQEMETLLDHAGFTILRRFGGPDCSPLTVESRFLVYVCECKESSNQ
jgi:SAM-dependent methyltransferase